MAIQDGYTLLVLGAGVMGTAVTAAVTDSKMKPFPGKVILCSQSEKSEKRLKSQFTQDFVEVIVDVEKKKKAIETADVVLLGCKPFHFEAVHAQVKDNLKHNPLVISLLAGVTIDNLSIFSDKIARVMTNTPAQFGAGMAAVALSEKASEYKQFVNDFAGCVGAASEIPEKNMDAATALIGSGPAMCLLMMEALYDGGVRMGLTHDVAKTAAAKVMEGTAKMALETGEHPAVLKSKVCTPAGTTIGGLLKLEDAGVRGSIARAVEEAANISASFAKK
ncbi:pyrroline-5-carboxylate reductase [Candidozyma duobushaemuli]|uniref:Pyrroline-5-carboxylate reductase n=2 Tax=Candidozyma TaxID=3303203 RepID=A0ABX8I491_9ASCO|nr:pyrroline-5-carboxylate reductase [[Candida] duobushaemulonis]PVH13661.1 pyrroline-5-carboxylate reductase [[Candida] duobushaemulonis]QWU88101.1 hypothetical protein CA3LBN_002366 [[Candida] haemuloni]